MKHVLLISATPETAAPLAALLAENGFQVSLLEYSNPAYESVTDGQYDLIIVDPDRPGMVEKNLAETDSTSSPTGIWQGTGIIRDLRTFNVTLPILVYTGHEG